MSGTTLSRATITSRRGHPRGWRFRPFTSATILTLLLILIASHELAAQHPAVAGVWFGEAGSGTGFALANAGDVDLDGLNDLIISSPYLSNAMTSNGTVRVFSSAGQTLLWQVYGLNPNEKLGLSIASPGDLDGDGYGDYLITGHSNPTTMTYFLRAYSGLNGGILYALAGPLNTSSFAQGGVTVLGDLDLDGVRDFAVGMSALNVLPAPAVLARIDFHSGSTGALLYSLLGPGSGSGLGAAMLGVGDVDGDLADDFLLSDPYEASEAGSISLFSGATGTLIYKVFGATPGERLGRSLVGLSDLDGDGHDDFAAGAWLYSSATVSQCGIIRAFSTLTGSQVFQRQGSTSQQYLGEFLQEAGDYDGDGKKDLVAVDTLSPWIMRVVSGATGLDIESIVEPRAYFFLPLGKKVAALGDLDGDGCDDFVTATHVTPGPWSSFPLGGSGTVQFYAGAGPVRPRVEYQGLTHGLGLHWILDGANPQSVTGTMLCDLGFPGGQGVVITSTGYHDEVVWGYLPLLVDLDPVFNPQAFYFNFDPGGFLLVPNLSRQDPALAGLRLQVQVIQVQPIVTSSNALEFLMTP